MIYLILADLVLLFHFAFLLFVTVGVALVFRWLRLAWIHVPCVFWGAWIEFRGWICPLTPLENGLRGLGGEARYPGGFIDHYLGPIIYPSGLTHRTQLVLGIALVVFNVGAYGLMAWRRLRAAEGTSSTGSAEGIDQDGPLSVAGAPARHRPVQRRRSESSGRCER